MKKTVFSAVMVLAFASLFANDAIANAEKFVRENKCKNLIANGSFERVDKKNSLVQWWPWKAAKSKGEFSRGQDAGVNASGAAVLSGGNIVISQDIKNVKPGEKYLIKIMVKKSSAEGAASLAVRSKAKRKWYLGAKTVSAPVKFAAADKWQAQSLIVTVQPGVDCLCVMLCASKLTSADSKIIFDNIEAYKVQ